MPTTTTLPPHAQLVEDGRVAILASCLPGYVRVRYREPNGLWSSVTRRPLAWARANGYGEAAADAYWAATADDRALARDIAREHED